MAVKSWLQQLTAGRVINSPAKSFNLNSSKMKNSSDGPVVGHEVEPRSNSSNSTNQLVCDEPARAAELELNSRQADATDSRPKSVKSSAHRLCHSVDSPQTESISQIHPSPTLKVTSSQCIGQCSSEFAESNESPVSTQKPRPFPPKFQLKNK